MQEVFFFLPPSLPTCDSPDRDGDHVVHPPRRPLPACSIAFADVPKIITSVFLLERSQQKCHFPFPSTSFRSRKERTPTKQDTAGNKERRGREWNKQDFSVGNKTNETSNDGDRETFGRAAKRQLFPSPFRNLHVQCALGSVCLHSTVYCYCSCVPKAFWKYVFC